MKRGNPGLQLIDVTVIGDDIIGGSKALLSRYLPVAVCCTSLTA